jgi:poly(3-hydroxybutyrate) depolymerase
MGSFLPALLSAGAALVVVFHGRTQAVAGYTTAEPAGRKWLIAPASSCYSSNSRDVTIGRFASTDSRPEDSRRRAGEALSIRRLIETVVSTQGVDPTLIFVWRFGDAFEN